MPYSELAITRNNPRKTVLERFDIESPAKMISILSAHNIRCSRAPPEADARGICLPICLQILNPVLFAPSTRTLSEGATGIVSIDIDVGCKGIVQVNEGRNDANVNDRLTELQIGERELPLIVSLLKHILSSILQRHALLGERLPMVDAS